MVTYAEKVTFLVTKTLSKLLRGIISKYNGAYYCINCPHSFRTANKLKSHEGVCKEHDYGHVKMSEALKRRLHSRRLRSVQMVIRENRNA